MKPHANSRDKSEKLPAQRLRPMHRHGIWLLVAFLLALSFFAIRSLVERFDNLNNAAQLRTWAATSSSVSLFIHELQRERGLASGYLASAGSSFKETYQTQRTQTDRALAELNPKIKLLRLNIEANQQLQADFDSLPELRTRILALKLSRDYAVDHYTNIINLLFTLQLNTFGRGIESAIFRQQLAFVTFMQAKEEAGQERALLSAMLSDKNFSAGRMDKLKAIKSFEAARTAYFSSMAEPQIVSAFLYLQEQPYTQSADRIRQKVRTAALYESSNGALSEKMQLKLPRAEEWFSLSSAKIDAMKTMEDALSAAVLNSTTALENRARQELIISAMLAILASILAGILINHLRRGQKAATQQLNLADAVFNNSVESILVTDDNNTIIEINPAFSQMTGYSREEVIGQHPRLLRSGRQDEHFYEMMWHTISKTGHWQGEIWNRRKNGDTYPALLSIAAVHDEKGKISNYTGMIFDLSQHKRVDALLKQLSTFDGLTGLPNRESWLSALDQAVTTGALSNNSFSVLELDLDRFKLINDSLGHSAGDKVLIEAAERIKNCLRRHDIVARPSGNRFSVLLADHANSQDIGTICEKLMSAFTQPFELDGGFTHITISIGVAIYPTDAKDTKTLMMAAESALYSAKADGRDLYKYYAQKMNESGLHLFKLERVLRGALGNNEFSVVYQPQISADDDSLVGVEALIRWKSPELGQISPVQFIPVAEETGLIVPIGEWVMKTALHQCKQWQTEFACDIPVAVNLSARQFRRNDLLASVQLALDECKLPSHLLELEITEGLLMSDPAGAIDIMRGLQCLGVTTALDDFGTGYSSLAYLKTFPLNRLKIDQAFVRDLPANDSDRAIANTVITLGLNLGMEVLAEGVETEAQRDFLKASGCQVFQGYFYSKPVSGEEISERIRRGELRLKKPKA
jgi:diguanylate cyclase (GGDEF)-like protein/PAS domain S-box-containing protein